MDLTSADGESFVVDMSLTQGDKIRRIRQFWDDRAKQYGDGCRATLGEVRLRKLEIRTMIKYIRKFAPSLVLDVGCGNGYSTKMYAQNFPTIDFLGVDYSPEMIKHARKNVTRNCSFDTADVLDIGSMPRGRFDLIITQRCLQNLPDYARQRDAIYNLISLKAPDGRLLLMECSKTGVAQLNRVRKQFCRSPLNNIEPWHNCFFVDETIKEDFKADIVYFSSTYMFISKVIHRRLSLVGYWLPPIGKFGYDRLYIL
ncbi:MAG: class I SAM-dependent methyltransferase [Thermodesulfobacteriota bacterium]|nr:class I SAM-dependent methyltransferase [Thermodesulfobacteriota bacterium]